MWLLLMYVGDRGNVDDYNGADGNQEGDDDSLTMKLILIIKTTTIALMTDNAINDDGAVDCLC